MRHRKFGAIIGLALAVGACSGGGSPESTATAAPSTLAAAPTDGFCADVIDVRNSVFSLQSYLEVGLEDYVRMFGETRDKMTNVEVPSEIADDWDTMSRFMTEMSDIFAGLDLSDPEAANAAAAEQAESVQELAAEAELASQRIDEFAEDYCGIEFNDPGTG